MSNCTPLLIALASGHKQIIDFILERPNQSVVPRGDFANQDAEFEAPPNLVEYTDLSLEHECKPLLICIAKRDWASLAAIWRRTHSWDSANFYKVVETLIKMNEDEGLKQFLQPRNHFINLYYEPKFLQTLLDENPNASE